MSLRRAAICAGVLLALILVLPGAASAAAPDASSQVSESDAIEIANQDPKVYDEKVEHPGLSPSARMVEGHWEVAYFDEEKELVLVLVDAQSGEVTEAWTGYQVAWKMARGYSGQFGHKLNAPWVVT